MITPTLRYYHLPSEMGEGWARIVLGSDGFFAAVSDFGNYAFLWTHHGMPDVRQFFLRAGLEWDYFLGKLSHGQVYDDLATLRDVKDGIIALRKERAMDRDSARAEWELLENNSNISSETDFCFWTQATDLGYDFYQDKMRWRHPSDVVAFCKRTMPRWAEMLRAELAAEAGARGAA